jgi:hypothetical protein
MHMLSKMRRCAIILLSLVSSELCSDASSVDISYNHGIVTTIDEAALMREARIFHHDDYADVISCERIVYVSDKDDAGCIAAQFIICVRDAERAEHIYKEWLWFDRNGKFCPEARSTWIGNSIISPNPSVSRDPELKKTN